MLKRFPILIQSFFTNNHSKENDTGSALCVTEIRKSLIVVVQHRWKFLRRSYFLVKFAGLYSAHLLKDEQIS